MEHIADSHIYSNKTKLFIKLISITLIFSFSLLDLAYAAPVLTSSTPNAYSANKLDIQSLIRNPSSINVPLDSMTLKEVYRGSSDKLIIHIQDAHANYSGQSNLAKALDHFMTMYDLPLVMVEGSSENVTLSDIRETSTPKSWSVVAKRFLYDGIISGEEYLNLTSNHPMQLIGIEDESLYQRSLGVYSDLTNSRQDNLKGLKNATNVLSKIKNQLYPKAILLYENELKENNASGDYKLEYEALLRLAGESGIQIHGRYAEIETFIGLRDQESKIGFEKATREQADLLKDLKYRGLSVQVRNYLQATQSTNLSQASRYTLLQNLFQISAMNGIDLSRYSSLSQYQGYLRQFTDLNLEKLLEEFEYLEHEVYESLIDTDDAFKVRAIERYINLLHKANTIQLSSREFDLLKKNDSDFNIVSWQSFLNSKLIEIDVFDSLLEYTSGIKDSKKQLFDFYDLVSRRDNAFLRNSVKVMESNSQNAAILIAGGYHTQNLTHLMREAQISYIVLTPVVSGETDHVKYEQLLLANQSALAKEDQNIDSDTLRQTGARMGASGRIARNASASKFARSRLSSAAIKQLNAHIPYTGNETEATSRMSAEQSVDESRTDKTRGAQLSWSSIQWIIDDIQGYEKAYLDSVNSYLESAGENGEKGIKRINKSASQIIARIDKFSKGLDEQSQAYEVLEVYRLKIESLHSDIMRIVQIYADYHWSTNNDEESPWNTEVVKLLDPKDINDITNDSEFIKIITDIRKKVKSLKDLELQIRDLEQEVGDLKSKLESIENDRDAFERQKQQQQGLKDNNSALVDALVAKARLLIQGDGSLEDFDNSIDFVPYDSKIHDALYQKLFDLWRFSISDRSQDKAEFLKKVNDLMADERLFDGYDERILDLELKITNKQADFDSLQKDFVKKEQEWLSRAAAEDGGQLKSDFNATIRRHINDLSSEIPSFEGQLYFSILSTNGVGGESILIETIKQVGNWEEANPSFLQFASESILTSMRAKNALGDAEAGVGRERMLGGLRANDRALDIIQKAVGKEYGFFRYRFGIPKQLWSTLRKAAIFLLPTSLLIFIALWASQVNLFENQSEAINRTTNITQTTNNQIADPLIGNDFDANGPSLDFAQLLEDMSKLKPAKPQSTEDITKKKKAIQEQIDLAQENLTSIEAEIKKTKDLLGQAEIDTLSESEDLRKRTADKRPIKALTQADKTEKPEQWNPTTHKNPTQKQTNQADQPKNAPKLKTKTITHGDGNRGLGAVVAEVEGDIGNYLATASYSQLNPLPPGEYSPSEPDWQLWSLENQKKGIGSVTFNLKGAESFMVPMPPGMAISAAQTANTGVQITTHYDKANGVWHIEFDQDPGLVKVEVRPAKAGELGSAPALKINPEHLSAWIKTMPSELQDLIKQAKDLPEEIRRDIQLKIMHLFYYTTNPRLKALSESDSEYPWTLLASDCDGACNIYEPLAHALGLPLGVIQTGFLKTQTGNLFFEGDAHAWVFENGEVIELTGLLGETSSLYQKEGVTDQDWDEEIELLARRAEHIKSQINLIMNQMQSQKKKVQAETQIKALKQAQNELDNVQLDDSLSEEQRKWLYYQALSTRYNRELINLNIQDMNPIQVRQLIESTLSLVSSSTGVTDEYQLMSLAHFSFSILEQAEEVVNDVEFVKRSRRTVHERLHSAALSHSWELDEPIYGESWSLITSEDSDTPNDFVVSGNSYSVSTLITFTNGVSSTGETPYAEVSLNNPSTGIQSPGISESKDSLGRVLFTSTHSGFDKNGNSIIGIVYHRTGVSVVNTVSPLGEILQQVRADLIEKEVVDVFSGEAFIIKANETPIAYSQGMLIVKDEGGAYHLQGDHAGPYENIEYKQIKFHSQPSLNGWIATVQYADGTWGVIGSLVQYDSRDYESKRYYGGIDGLWFAPNGEWVLLSRVAEDGDGDGTADYTDKYIWDGPLVEGRFDGVEPFSIAEGYKEPIFFNDGKWLIQIPQNESMVRTEEVNGVETVVEKRVQLQAQLIGPFIEQLGLQYSTVAKLEVHVLSDGTWIANIMRIDGDVIIKSSIPNFLQDIIKDPNASIHFTVYDNDEWLASIIGNKGWSFAGPVADKFDLNNQGLEHVHELYIPNDASSWMAWVPFTNTLGEQDAYLIGPMAGKHAKQRRIFVKKPQLGNNGMWVASSSGSLLEREVGLIGSAAEKANLTKESFIKKPSGHAESLAILNILPNGEFLTFAEDKALGPIADRVGITGKTFEDIRRVRIKQLVNGQVWVSILRQRTSIPEIFTSPRPPNFWQRIESRYGVGSLVSNPHTAEYRYDLRFAHFDDVAEHNVTEATRLLSAIIADWSEAKSADYFDANQIGDILSRRVDLLAQLTDVELNFVLGKLKNTPYQHLTLVVLDQLNEDRAIEIKNDLGFNENTWLNILGSYIGFLNEQAGYDSPRIVHLSEFLYKHTDREKAKQINALAKQYLSSDGQRNYAIAEQSTQKAEAVANKLNISTDQAADELTSENLQFIVQDLRVGSGWDYGLFDVEVSLEDKDNPVFELTQLLKSNTELLKLRDTEERQSMEEWKAINAQLNEIFGEDFDGQHTLESVWEALWDEFKQDGLALGFLIGFLHLLTYGVSNQLRQRDIILGKSAESVINAIWKNNPWFKGKVGDRAFELLKEISQINRVATDTQVLRLDSFYTSLTGPDKDQQRALIDVIRAIAVDPPEQARKTFVKSLINLIPLISSATIRDARAQRDRQRMNAELLELSKSIGVDSPEVFYQKFAGILKKYAKEDDVSDELSQKEGHLEPDEFIGKFDKVWRELPLIRVNRAQIRSRLPNGAQSRRRGKESGLAGVRKFASGDTLRDVNWKVSGRQSSGLVVNERFSDQKLPASVLVDMRALRDVDKVDDWLADLAKSLSLGLAKGRVYGEERYTLNKIIFISPEGEVLSRKIGKINDIRAIIKTVYAEHYLKLGSQLNFKIKPQFYTPTEQERYVKKSQGIGKQQDSLSAEETQDKLHTLGLSYQDIFLVGVDGAQQADFAGIFESQWSHVFTWQENSAELVQGSRFAGAYDTFLGMSENNSLPRLVNSTPELAAAVQAFSSEAAILRRIQKSRMGKVALTLPTDRSRAAIVENNSLGSRQASVVLLGVGVQVSLAVEIATAASTQADRRVALIADQISEDIDTGLALKHGLDLDVSKTIVHVIDIAHILRGIPRSEQSNYKAILKQIFEKLRQNDDVLFEFTSDVDGFISDSIPTDVKRMYLTDTQAADFTKQLNQYEAEGAGATFYNTSEGKFINIAATLIFSSIIGRLNLEEGIELEDIAAINRFLRQMGVDRSVELTIDGLTSLQKINSQKSQFYQDIAIPAVIAVISAYIAAARLSINNTNWTA